MEQFHCLLNAFERAAQADKPADAGYAEKRAALIAHLEVLDKDSERYRWLRDNAGAWEVSRDVVEWTRAETGEKFKPRVYFTAYSTAYGGRTLDEAIDAAMKGANG